MSDQLNIKTNNSEKHDHRLNRWISSLTIEEKVGQLLIGGYETVDEIIPLLKKGMLGGVILFKRNIHDAEQTRQDITRMKQAVTPHLPPIFVSVDQEGGRVSRLPDDLGPFASARDIASAGNPDDAASRMLHMGMVLKQLGFNLNYAPVLDIDSNPANPVIGERAYGKTADTVIKYATIMIRSMRQSGVIPVGKHFPGHGDTGVDSHIDWPIIEKSIAELSQFELQPFKTAIDQEIEMIMAAHVVVRKISNHPTSLSRDMITGLLRDNMGYKGVIITDDLTMGAITKHYTIPEAVVKAIEAGCDLLPVCHGIEKQEEAFKAILQAVKSGKISIEQINESLYRTLALKLRC